MSYIVELRAENVKRLKLVEVKLDKGVVTVGGRNAQGKTSVLDAIAMALGGQALVPPEPIRRGAAGGEVRVKLDDGTVIRRMFTEGGKSTLSIHSAEGVPVKSPQALLDSLLGKISFDPLAFMRLDTKAQAEALRKLTGVDTTLLDGRRLKAYEERTEVSREVKRLEGALAKLPPAAENVPAEEVSVDELAAEFERRRAHNAARAQAARGLEQLRESAVALKTEIADLEQRLAAARLGLDQLTATGKAEAVRVAEMQEADESEVLEQLKSIQATNAVVRAAAGRKALEVELEAKRSESMALTESIQKIDDQKRGMLTSSKLPVPGLTFDDSGVRYNDVPLEQVSGAERIRISAAIGLATNPKLKVLRIYDGSLLDQESMAALAELAANNDAQIIVERVDGSGASIMIEDGQVVGAERTAAPEPPANGDKTKKQGRPAVVREPGSDG